ncbi:hypothetical protein [Streptomyces sp. NPDC056670]|uniref:hypothetical protein n=1 Tax=Streptomyces sp. NPDC056670 TaxID=3345904 RepID=UPI0036AC9E87
MHWHAYAWVGHERPADNIRNDKSQPTPPLRVGEWLGKPERFIVAIFDSTPEGISDALEWMRQGAEEHVYVSEASFPLDARLKYVAEQLSHNGRAGDVVWGYYSKSKRYVSRALIACTCQRKARKPAPYLEGPHGQ